MARKREMASRESEKGVSKAVSVLDKDMQTLRRAFKAIKILSPEARRLLRAMMQRM
jgi:hypothetical protein